MSASLNTAHATARASRRGITLVAAATGLAMLLAGCENMGARERGTAQGAGIGAVAGAAIGAMTGGKNTVKGAAIGAAAGAIAGNLWSKHMEEQRRAMEQATAGTGVDVVRTPDNQLKLNIPSDISFATGSAALKPELREVLQQFAQGLKENPGTLVRVVGHTDNVGSDTLNNKLSLERADTVRDFLEDRGVSRSRIEVAGRGEREPVASNDSAEGRAKNRRVEIFLREPEGGVGNVR
ncbi:MAG: OmpA family protein [Proteobacteria bacterium]|uniref:OmpA family protein n=1 Tax=Aquabacterium sp. TaxID=1872578 RepID=UPI0035C6DE2F|nr:OmpA family protein [Pseudomonadota bacterium]